MTVASQVDLAEARRFLNLLSSESDKFTFQTFDDSDEKRGHLVKILHGTMDQHARTLNQLNQQGAGIFVTINETDLRGRKTENVIRVRRFFVDTDGAPYKPILSDAKLGDLLPSCVVESSPDNYHVYWKANAGLSSFETIQLGLANKYNTDKCVHDLPRVMRLPGFFHQKRVNGKYKNECGPFLVRIRAANNAAAPFTPSEITQRLALKPLQSIPLDLSLNEEAIAATKSTPLPESPEEIARVNSMLNVIPADCDRSEWLKVIWAIAATGWSRAEELARTWSMTALDKYNADAFNKAFNSFDPNGGVGFGTLVHHAKQYGWVEGAASQNLQTIGQHQQKQYTLKTVADLKAMPPASWRIKHILPKHGLASIYGPSGSGKTFVVLDLGVSICMGDQWFNSKTESCPVVYVALEGASGITNRLKAWEQHHVKSIPDSFKVVTDHLSLFNDKDIEEFAKVLLDHGASDSVIFIDTLNQSAPEADENTSKDMGRIISRAMRLQELTNSLVILVHHTGKDTGKGLRGHSSLHAALDAAIEVKKDSNGRAWSLSKAKDGVDGIPNNFRLEVVALGKDSDGEDITSCVVMPDMQAVFKPAPKKPRGPNQTIALKEINTLMLASQIQAGGGPIKINTEDAIAAVGSAMLCDAKRKRERALSAINGLIAAGILTRMDDQLWLS